MGLSVLASWTRLRSHRGLPRDFNIFLAAKFDCSPQASLAVYSLDLLIFGASPRPPAARAHISQLTMTNSSPSSSIHQNVVPSEVGWQFVPQYYTFVNKHPNRLHCFYTKQSTFIHGTEGEECKPCFGQHVRIPSAFPEPVSFLAGNPPKNNLPRLPRLQGFHSFRRRPIFCKWRYHHPGHW